MPPPTPARAAEKAKTATSDARPFMPSVAQAAGLSFMASRRCPNSDRRTATTSATRITKATEPAMNWDVLELSASEPMRKGAKTSDPEPKGA